MEIINPNSPSEAEGLKKYFLVLTFNYSELSAKC